MSATAAAPAAAPPPAAAAPAASKPRSGGAAADGKQAPPPELAYTFEGSVELATPEHAAMVRAALDVDAELNAGQVARRLTADGRTLRIEFAATELRLLRAAVSALYDLLALAVRAAERFDPGKGGQDGGEAAAAAATTTGAEAAAANGAAAGAATTG